MKIILAGIALSTLTTSSALAADIEASALKTPTPTVTASSWTGFYLGAGVGMRSTEADVTVPNVTRFGVDLPSVCAALASSIGFTCFANDPLNDTAFRLGSYIGFNWQIGRQWVVGIEGDAGFASKTTTVSGLYYPVTGSGNGVASDTFSIKTTWDASARGRIGFLLTPTVLAYATGGAAWVHVEATSNCNTNPTGDCAPGSLSPSVITDSTTRLGWTIGGGIEAALWPNWIARAEYRYADFGTVTKTDVRAGGGVPFPLTVTYDLGLRTHTGLFGLAYKFGDPVAATTATPMPVKAPAATVAGAPSWAGPYLGAAVGVRSAVVDATVTDFFLPPDNLASICALLAPDGGCFTSASLNNTAFRFSPYLGFNWQIGRQWVAGVEGDFGFAGKTATLNGLFYPTSFFRTTDATDTFSIKTTWDASARGRIGFLITPTVLAYATGGGAWLHVEATSNCGSCIAFPFSPVAVTHTTTKLGWTIGGGIEAALWSNWIARAEYRFADFGAVTNADTRAGVSFNAGIPLIATYDLGIRTHTALFGLGYKFN